MGAFNPNLIPHFGLLKFYVENASYVKDFEQKKVYLEIYRRKKYQRYKIPLLYMDSKYPIQLSGRFPQFHTENLQSVYKIKNGLGRISGACKPGLGFEDINDQWFLYGKYNDAPPTSLRMSWQILRLTLGFAMTSLSWWEGYPIIEEMNISLYILEIVHTHRCYEQVQNY